LFTTLKRYAYAPIAALALWAVLLLILPAMADAKETSQANELQGSKSGTGVADYVVVLPGDSLWLISERQLGPGATLPQIANGVEQLYALNQDQIGADPNTIYVGQRFVLPSALERHAPRQAPEPTKAAPGAAPAQGTTAPDKAAPRDRVAQSHPDEASRPTAGESRAVGAKVPEAAVQRRSLPDEAAMAPVPVVKSLAADGTPPSPVAFFGGIRSMVLTATSAVVESVVTNDRYAGRQLFGLALILMSLSIGVFTIVVAVVRPPRLTMGRHEHKKRLYRPAAFAYDAAPLVGLRNPRAEVGEETTRLAPLEEREPHKGSVNSRNGSSALDAARRNARVAPIENSKRHRLRRARKRGPAGPARRLPRGARGSGARHSLALSAGKQRMNRRRKIVGENSKVPFAPGEWDISESLRRSLESLPLQPGEPMDQVLAELRPQVEVELRSVALLERRRRLSECEHRQASALRSILALV
jgi:LysM domain